MMDWNNSQPIFLQIRQQLIQMILAGDGDTETPLPSVRRISADFAVNPLTVTKSYQSLVDLGIVEKRRGLGMFLRPDAREKLKQHERESFLREDWPPILNRIRFLELDLSDLLNDHDTGNKDDA